MESQGAMAAPESGSEVPPLQSASPANTSSGKLKISLRGKVVKTFDTTPAAAPSANVPITSPSTDETNPVILSSLQSSATYTPIGPEIKTQIPPSEDSTDPEVDQRLEDLKWCARSLLRKLFAEHAREYAFVPGSKGKEEPATIIRQEGVVPDSLKPDSPEEALLMLAALRALGKPDAARVLLPPLVQSTEPSELTANDSTQMAVDATPATAGDRSSTFDLKLSKEEVMIAKNAAKSAAQTAPSLMRNVEEDDESLALELELEFAQLDPETRAGLLRQIDAAERTQFFESNARSERLARAAREAAFHNAQVNVDRGRVGPYYFDPHTRTHQVLHTIAVEEAACQAVVPAPSDPNLLIINPDLPLPNGFEYLCKQKSSDFHPSLFAKLSREQRKVFKISLASRAATKPKNTSITDTSKKEEVIDDTVRYAVMEGYVQWLKREVESHWNASAPLVPYESFLSQFKHQWDVLQPQGCFDYLNPDAQQYAPLNASTTLWSSSGGPNNNSKSGIVSGAVSEAIRKVWRAHRKNLEAEHAVELAMSAAERGLRRATYGDAEDISIDIGKHSTRDERRKLHRHEKERAKLISLFSAQGLVDPNDFPPLEQLSWRDLQTLFAALGLSAETMMEEEISKAQLPTLQYGPNGQVRARSHKKGAAKAARMAVRKATMSPEAASEAESEAGSLSRAPSTTFVDLTSIPDPKKRSRVAYDDQFEADHFQSTVYSHYAHQRAQSSTPQELLQHCQVCGSSDNDDDFVRCATCQLTYHTFCLEDIDNITYDGSWICHNCSTVSR